MNNPHAASKIGADQAPVTSAFLKEAVEKAAQMFNWEERKKRSGERKGSKVTGIGIGQGYHTAGSNGFDGLVRKPIEMSHLIGAIASAVDSAFSEDAYAA